MNLINKYYKKIYNKLSRKKSKCKNKKKTNKRKTKRKTKRNLGKKYKGGSGIAFQPLQDAGYAIQDSFKTGYTTLNGVTPSF